MKLLTQQIRNSFPPWRSTDGQGDEAKIIVKFFTPDSNWTWYATEFDGDDTFFGLVSGHEVELGYFSLKEIEGLRGPLGMPIERDARYGDHTISDARKVHRRHG